MSRWLIFLIFLLPAAFSQESENCETSLSRLFASSDANKEKLQEFLNIQAGLTLHKLAYATLRNTHSKEQYRIEDEILKLLEKVKAKNESDPKFKEVYDMYHHPKNKLSRTALARVLPYVKDILNDQEGEQSTFKRTYFNIGMSDIKMLAILAEKEGLRSNGDYEQILLANKDSDKSILNFVKIINSSIRNTDDSLENIQKTIERRTKKLHTYAINLLKELDLSPECEAKILGCVVEEDGQSVLDEKALSFLTEIAEGIGDFDKHAKLRYNDVWLYTKGKTSSHSNSGSRGGIGHGGSKPKGPKTLYTYQAPAKDPDAVIHEYLVDHVLQYMPQLFSREELMQDKELTLALSQAIDKGKLVSSGENRYFVYKGNKYSIPELWNDDYSTLGMGRLGQKVDKYLNPFPGDWKSPFRDLAHGWDELVGNDKFKVPDSIPEKLKEDFKTTRYEQKVIFNHQYTFAFNGALYDIKTGKKIQTGKNSILKAFKLGSTSEKLANSPLNASPEEKKKIAKEINDNNRSFIKDNTAFHISGVKVSFDKEYERAQTEYNKTNTNISHKKTADSQFPDKKKLDVFVNDMNLRPLVLKALADRKQVFSQGDKFYNLYSGKELTKSDAVNAIIQDRKQHGINRSPANYSGFDDTYLKANASAIFNNEQEFEVDGKRYYTQNGKTVRREISNSPWKGYINHEEVIQRENSLNQLDNKNLVIQFHKTHTSSQCEFYTLVDKKAARLEVIKNSGEVVFTSEILLGEVSGDERTLYKDQKLQNTNKKTGAGIYYTGTQEKDANGNSYLGLTLGEGEDRNVVMNLAPVAKDAPEREGLIDNGSLEDNYTTNGGVVLPKNKMGVYQQQFSKEGCPFYVLPETNKVKFVAEENRLRMLPNSSPLNPQDYYFTDREEIAPKDIKLYIKDDRYRSPFTENYLGTLEKEKSRLMKMLNLTNNEFNELAKLSFGILGTESNFNEGEDWLKIWNTYKFKESNVGQYVVSVLKGNFVVVPLAGQPSVIPLTYDNSRGPTQIKHVAEYLKKEYPEINADNLNQPENAAIATFIVAATKYRNVEQNKAAHSGINESNKYDYVYYDYLGSMEQIKNSAATPILNPKVSKAIGFADKIDVLTRP